MDSVYFYKQEIGKDIADKLKEDNFRHISYIVRDSSNPERKGYFLYVRTTPDDMKLLDEKLKDLGSEKVEGEEEKKIIDVIKAEEENAASGMGMIFG
jgi:hypothetical protein